MGIGEEVANKDPLHPISVVDHDMGDGGPTPTPQNKSDQGANHPSDPIEHNRHTGNPPPLKDGMTASVGATVESTERNASDPFAMGYFPSDYETETHSVSVTQETNVLPPKTWTTKDLKRSVETALNQLKISSLNKSGRSPADTTAS